MTLLAAMYPGIARTGIGLAELPTMTQCPAVKMWRGSMITPVHAAYRPGSAGSHTTTVQGAAVIDTVFPPTAPNATPSPLPISTRTTTTNPMRRDARPLEPRAGAPAAVAGGRARRDAAVSQLTRTIQDSLGGPNPRR